MAMNIGKLNIRLMLQQQATTQDAIGQPHTTWSDVAPLWADVKYASGLQSIKADSDASTVKVSLRIRYRTDVKAAMRLVEQGTGTVYKINAPLPRAQKDYIDLVCEVTT